MSDLNTLLDLCAAAQAERHARLRAEDEEANEEAVRLATEHAAITFGAEAAAALGEWLPALLMGDDTLQAHCPVGPGVFLEFTWAEVEGTASFEALTYCPTCSNHRTSRVADLESLAMVLHGAGVAARA